MSIDVRLLPSGPRAVLAEVAALDDVIALAAAMRADRPDTVIEIVPAARTVLILHDGDASHVQRWILERARAATAGSVLEPGPLVTIDVRYDGIDLDDVAVATALSVDEVIHRHAEPTYTAAFCGFVPGFAYLIGLDPRLQLPRRAAPRPRVPAGSVAVASDLTGVYPTSTAGGWHLLGTTSAAMWDDGRDPPALVVPGARVRFRPV